MKEQDARLCIHEFFRNITLTFLAFLNNCSIQCDLTSSDMYVTCFIAS